MFCIRHMLKDGLAGCRCWVSNQVKRTIWRQCSLFCICPVLTCRSLPAGASCCAGGPFGACAVLVGWHRCPAMARDRVSRGWPANCFLPKGLGAEQSMLHRPCPQRHGALCETPCCACVCWRQITLTSIGLAPTPCLLKGSRQRQPAGGNPRCVLHCACPNTVLACAAMWSCGLYRPTVSHSHVQGALASAVQHLCHSSV